MTKTRIKIGVLSSSRADYGIYKPLLNKLKIDERFDLEVIAFGMHLQEQHGATINEIEQDNYCCVLKVDGMSTGDNPIDISAGYGNLVIAFSSFWNKKNYDWVLVLGDRFEMSAAVQAGIPFEIKFAHLHGGETTLGAVDNIYRHQITLASKLHFTAAEEFSERVNQLVDQEDCVFNVGALSLSNIKEIQLPKWSTVCERFQLPSKPFVLTTFHPETIGLEKNVEYIDVLKDVLSELCKSIHIIITMANADALGKLYRSLAQNLKIKFPENISLVDSFGKENYFSAMKSCSFLLGNTSSGILEAASFQKYVINVGDRQSGRLRNNNVIDVPFNKQQILSYALPLIDNTVFTGENKFSGKDTAHLILETIISKSSKK